MALHPSIEKIHERNQRVELDKAWETSFTRRAIIAILTYVTLVIFLLLINAPNPYVNALVPTLGFILSTMGLSVFKGWWAKNLYIKNRFFQKI